ncbi:hypothetical protein RN001_011996 [Aquatica leii]|uniref:Uncharacterized protein n=1 Tax=Aquatica leii TaxID=1421715 RepID=A0AAN7P2E1_9COLE|nr:hypothetical protein RN001_011996 [Aquatica leii]
MQNNEGFDDTLIKKYLVDAENDIITLLKDLEYTYNLNPTNQRLHELKMKSCLVNLEVIDSKLFHAYNALNLEDEDDLASNFGISVKLEIAKEKLNDLKEKHSNLNKEWHSQDEHLNKISKKVSRKEEELKAQSVLCTIQGLTFGKLLWKFSKNSKFLEIIVANEKLTLELIKIYSGCLYGFIHTFKNQLPDPMTDEHQFVLCLTGIFSNFATIPDGRFFLLHQPICREVLDQMIKSAFLITTPNGEQLKFLTLSTIYNIMICQEGLEFTKNHEGTMYVLKNCINSSNSERIILMSLKIINILVGTSKPTVDKLNFPVKELKKLDYCCNNPAVRKQAKEILAMLQQINSVKTSGRTVPNSLVTSKPKNENINRTTGALACYVVTDKNISNGFRNKKPNTVSEFSQNFGGTCSKSYTSSSSVSSVVEFSNSLQLSKCTDMSTSGSELIRQKTSTTGSKNIVINNQLSPKEEKSVSCNLELSPDNDPLNQLHNLNSIESEEIQNVQYQFPYTNMDNTFAITIGDNLHNPRRINRLSVRDAHHTEGEPINTSIVTVYRVNNSQLFAVSNNSILPFTHVPHNDTQTSPMMSESCLKVTQGLTNIIDQLLENVPVIPSEVSSHELKNNHTFIANASSNEDDYDVLNEIKCNKPRRKKRSRKKKCKSKIPVFKIPFRRRKKRT